MATTRYITAIKMGPGGKEEHITLCLCLNPSTGKTIKWFPRSVVREIDKGDVFKVGSEEGKVAVVAVRPKTGEPYVRTEANGKRTDNLLQLPRF